MTNNYNVTYSDIVNAYSNVTATDFGSSDLITAEIERQAQVLNSLIPDSMNKLAQRVDLEIATVVASGSLNVFTPGLYANSATIEGWIIYKDCIPCSPNEFYNPMGVYWTESSLGVGTTASFTNNGNNLYTLNTSLNSKLQYLVISYDVLTTSANYGILKTLLRDMVAYSLGSQIFPSGTSVWSAVQYYKEQSEKYLKMIEEGKFKTNLGVNLLYKQNGWNSIRITRG